MGTWPILEPKLLARHAARAWPNAVAVPEGGWALRARGGDAAVLLDWDLKERFRVPLERLGAPIASGLAFDLARRRLGLSSPDLVAVCDLSGEPMWVHKYPRRDCNDSSECVFTADGEGLLVVTEVEGDGGDELHLFRASDGQVLAAENLELHQAGCGFHSHPDGRTIVIDAGEGQDGSFIFWVRTSASDLQTTRLPGKDRIFGGFDPLGDRYVTLPHSEDYENGIQVHSFPSGEVLARVEWSDLASSDLEDQFDFYGHFVNDELILAGTFLGRLFLLSATTLQPHAELVLNDSEEPRVRNGPGYAEDSVPIRAGRPEELLSSHYRVGLRAWAIKPESGRTW